MDYRRGSLGTYGHQGPARHSVRTCQRQFGIRTLMAHVVRISTAPICHIAEYEVCH